ncbi:hypothetical protein ABBQ32_000453 [Trebouxia sp. C0010 RCD-2024]
MDQWDQLLASSEGLVQGNPLGMPRVSRTINQVQQLSEKMVSKVQHRDTTTDGLASARLLAQQGLNQRQLSKALSKFEMKPTYEDVYQTQHPSVDEYLRHVQQSTLLSAIQEAQKDAVSAFDDFMDECMERDWAQDRGRLVGQLMPIGASSKPQQSLPATQIRNQPAPLLLQGVNGATPMEAQPQRSEQANRYAEVVRAVNKVLVTGSQDLYDAVNAFLAACPEEDNADKKMTVHKAWVLLSTMAAQLKGVVSAPDRTAALVVGARAFLEQSYQQYIRSKLQERRSQGALSSSNTLDQLQAFARMSHQEHVDDKDLAWQVVFLALRAGHTGVAVKVAKGIRDPSSGVMGHSTFEEVLERWRVTGHSLSQQQRSNIAKECTTNLLGDHSQTGLKALQHKYRVAAHAVLAADSGLADQVAKEAGIIGTIEDFMWLKLHLVQPSLAASMSTSNRQSPTATSSMLSPPYSITTLQEEVLHWGPAFFSQDGAQPLVYVVVLLMSQHFRKAVEYMGDQAGLREHGTHMAIACNHHKLLSPEEQNQKVRQIIQQYGQDLTATDARLALEYYWQAAAVVDASQAVKEDLLRQLLIESKAYGSLLGSGGVGDPGALSSFIPDASERQRMMEAVGDACEQQGQLETARELYLAAPNPCAALRIMNRQLSDLIKPAIADEAAGEELAGLLRRAADAQNSIEKSSLQHASAAQQELQAFQYLQIIRDLLAAAHR